VKLGRKGNPFWQAPPRSLSQAREVSASPRAPLSQVRQERGAFAAQLEAHKPHIHLGRSPSIATLPIKNHGAISPTGPASNANSSPTAKTRDQTFTTTLQADNRATHLPPTTSSPITLSFRLLTPSKIIDDIPAALLAQIDKPVRLWTDLNLTPAPPRLAFAALDRPKRQNVRPRRR
jgi:hypothetical protein